MRNPFRLKGRTLGTALLYSVLFFVFFAVERVDEILRLLPSEPPGSQFLKNASGTLYQIATALVPQPRESRFVTLVRLDRSHLPASLASNACENRAFLSALLPRLSDACPMMIAIDLVFTDEGCGAGAPQTATLKKTIEHVSEHVAVVLPMHNYTYEEARENAEIGESQVRSIGLQKNELLLRPTLFEPESLPANVTYSLPRANRDLLKVPIVWPVRGPATDSHNMTTMPSIAFQAAWLYRQTFPEGSARLEELQRRQFHPYADFLSNSQFTQVNALETFCNEEHVRSKDWTACGTQEGSTTERAKLRGRILIVGWADAKTDTYTVGSQTMPGYMLHANYVEALLDGRTFRPVGFVIQIVISFSWFGAIEMVFRRKSARVSEIIALALGAWVLFAFLIFYVAFVNLGWYLNPLPPSLLAIVIRGVQEYLKREERTDVKTHPIPASV